MRVGRGRAAAVEWVMRHACGQPWFRGAYFSGSTVALPDDAVLPVASDVDVVVVTAAADPPVKLGKFVYLDTLLEVTYRSWHELSSVAEVLTSYHLAGSFRTDTIIVDPTGQLGSLHAQVAGRFAEHEWVRRRCENARQKIENGMRAVDVSAPWHDKVMTWLFRTGVTTHVLLVAALRNPTVRLRYLAAHDVLRDYGRGDVYPELLGLLGCAELTRECIEGHLTELARTFDATAAVARTPFFFSSDITPAARRIAIEGSRELIDAGRHREAVFWIVATFARCHTILVADAPRKLRRALTPGWEAILADLGITCDDDLVRRSDDVIRFLPRLWEVTEDVLTRNPQIVRPVSPLSSSAAWRGSGGRRRSGSDRW